MIWILIFLAALLALLHKHEELTATCACAEFAGDNRDCPVRVHRNQARAYERIGRRSGRDPQ